MPKVIKSRRHVYDEFESNPKLKAAVEKSKVVFVKSIVDNPGYDLLAPKFTNRRDGQVYYDPRQKVISDDDESNDDDSDQSSSAAATDEGTPPEYEVEKIINKIIYNGTVRFETKWRNYDPRSNTYEPISNLQNSLRLIQDYEIKNAKQKVEVEISKIELKNKIDTPPPKQFIKEIFCFDPVNNKYHVLW